MPISVATIEDDPIVQRFLGRLLQNSEECMHAGAAYAKDEALELIHSDRADVYLVDIHLGDVSGIELIRHIRSLRPDAVCLVLSSVSDQAKIIESIQAGAKGYLLKDEHPDDLIRKIVDAHHGRAPISPLVANALIQSVAMQHPQPLPPASVSPSSYTAGIFNLTKREFQILQKLASTDPVKTIAAELHISPFTVNQHILHIYRKLGVRNRIAALVKAHEYKIL